MAADVSYRPSSAVGTCGGGMVGLLRMLAGEGDRELSDPDWSSVATSWVTWLSQGVVFGAVMADAAMLDSALVYIITEIAGDARAGEFF